MLHTSRVFISFNSASISPIERRIAPAARPPPRLGVPRTTSSSLCVCGPPCARDLLPPCPHAFCASPADSRPHHSPRILNASSTPLAPSADHQLCGHSVQTPHTPLCSFPLCYSAISPPHAPFFPGHRLVSQHGYKLNTIVISRSLTLIVSFQFFLKNRLRSRSRAKCIIVLPRQSVTTCGLHLKLRKSHPTDFLHYLFHFFLECLSLPGILGESTTSWPLQCSHLYPPTSVAPLTSSLTIHF